MKKSMKNRVAGAAAVLLAGSMAFSMTGCGSSSDNTAGQQTTTDQKTEGNEEYTKIVYAFKSFNNIPEDLSDVNEAISEITREKIGVEVELMPIASSAYGQQVSLAMQGGEQLDLFHTGSGLELSTCLANHQLYDITDIVKEHAAGAIDAVGEDFMKTEVVGGKVYGIPADKGVALAPTLLYREDIMEEIGVDPADIKNINDLTDVYAKVKEAYGISFFVTITGTLLSVLFTTTLAYPMSRKDFKFSKILTFLVFFTMLFNGGVVPSYMMWSQFFHLKNTIWALILPNYLITAFNIMLVKNYYQNSIPDALIEAAEIDGASELTIFWKIVFPLSTPVIATISLFTALKYWNDWVNALYYITKPQLYGIQNLLLRIMDNIQFLKSGGAGEIAGAAMVDLPGTSVRMAMAVVGILPIILIYPFVQKYFIKGVVVGAVKG